jgi:inosine-uridine nucleoside N-ribohydrolase
MNRVILDTDIGTDVDDALALALAAASPELRIERVTAVHADAHLRARIARTLLNLTGREDVPVIAGTSTPLQAPLPEHFHWGPRLWGHEGVGVLPPEDLIPTADPDTNADAAARFIIEKAPAHPGELSLITVGPLTTRREAMACLGATTKRYVSHSNGTDARGFLELLTDARFVCGHLPGTYVHARSAGDLREHGFSLRKSPQDARAIGST